MAMLLAKYQELNRQVEPATISKLDEAVRETCLSEEMVGRANGSAVGNEQRDASLMKVHGLDPARKERPQVVLKVRLAFWVGSIWSFVDSHADLPGDWSPNLAAQSVVPG